MATGGEFGEHRIEWFNGGLFARGEDHALLLNQTQLRTLHEVAKSDWHGVDPSIFGTLFERLIDPGERSQIGAHYTGEADIKLVTDPVIMEAGLPPAGPVGPGLLRRHRPGRRLGRGLGRRLERDRRQPPPGSAPDELKARRAEVDQLVLAALLRLNHERAEAGPARATD